ncbi:MAG: hypothetical protein ACR2PQ_00045 [Myxococcota bacterium]
MSFDLGTRLFLLALLLTPPIPWLERVPLLVAASAGLLLPELLRSKWLWTALLALLALPLVWNWPFSDNHDYLKAFFALGALCALATPTPERSFATSARWLVGLAFAFALLWKAVLSPDFVDGRFFRVTLLSDGRFENLAVLAGGTTYEQWEANDLRLDQILRGEPEPEPDGAPFREPDGNRRLAGWLTWLTLASEFGVALTFLWPLGRGPSRLRHVALLAFAAGTYGIATVRGFGWVLIALGVSQCEPDSTPTRLAYLGAFALIGIYHAVPWTSWLVEHFGAGT